MKYGLVLVLSLLLCCGDRPGETRLLNDAGPMRLARETLEAETITSPYRLSLEKGRSVLLHLGNPGGQKVEVTLEGAGTEKIDLAPGRWTAHRIELVAETLSLTWPGESLLLGHPYLESTRKAQANAKHEGPLNVMLLSIDTLREDHFSAEHMPQTFDLFKRNGIVFNRIYTTTPWTLPAHVSLLTGTYPARHGVRRPDQKLGREGQTLAEVFRDQGYFTQAFTEGNYVSAVFGVNRGFHRFYENPPLMMDKDEASISKLEPNIETLKQSLSLSRSPQFVFFHTYEVHCPYLPHEQLTDEEGHGYTQWLLDHDGQSLTEEQLAHLKALYASEVAYTDRLLAPLLKTLLDSGRWLVVLTSDHGEEFGEHGGLLHADTLYEETARIPLAIAGGTYPYASMNTSLPGSIVDVPSTILALLDLPIPEGWQGNNLTLTQPPMAPVFAESFFFGPHIPVEDPRLLGVWHQQDKLIQSRNFDRTTAELFQLDQDPGEQANRQEADPARRDALFLLIENYLKTRGDAADTVGNLSPEQEEVMRSLGYIQ